MTLAVAIVDDEAPARARLQSLLEGRPGVRVAAVCGDAATAISTLRQHPVDLLFLDIALPEIDGFGVLGALGTARPAVVFVTAFDEHAVRAFEVEAIDYLLKPFDRQRFEAVLARATTRLATPASARPAIEQLLVPVEDGSRLLHTRDIDWIGSAGNYVELHVGPETHLLRGTMTELEQRLGPTRFLRIHRDTIVNLERLCRFDRWLGGRHRAVLLDGTARPVGRRYRAALESRLGKL